MEHINPLAALLSLTTVIYESNHGSKTFQSCYFFTGILNRATCGVMYDICAPGHQRINQDLPGYGQSTPSAVGHDKLTIGIAIIEATRAAYRHKISNGPLKVVLIGHDRGARVFQRVGVSANKFPDVEILSVILMDIVPLLTEWESFSDPRSAVGYFHWSFLPNVDLATRMINKFGGGQWCKERILGGAGSAKSKELLTSGDALEVYSSSFENPAVIKASCEDYRAAAGEDLDAQREDQKAGRKLEIPTLVMFSESGLGNYFDFSKVWKKWVKEGTRIEVRGISDSGHFLPEEAPDQVLGTLLKWLRELGYVKRLAS